MTAPDEWYDASDWVDHDPDYGKDIDDEDDRHTSAPATDPDDTYEDEEDDEYPDAEEWQPGEGQCDNCGMAPGEVGPLGICCACSIGEGATPGECVCGPRNTPEDGARS